LAVNSAIDKAKAVKTTLSDLEARARANSPNPSAHYVERHYNRAPGLPGTRQRKEQENNAPGRRQKPKGPCFVCWKRGCWSSNHPLNERKAAYEKHVGKKKAQQYITIVDDDELWAKMGIADPSVYVAHTGRNREDSDEEETKEEEEDLALPLDFSTPPGPAPNTFFLHSSLAPEEDLINSLGNAATYHAATRKMPKTTVRWEKNRWYGIMIDTGAARGNTAGKAQVIAMQQFLGAQAPKIEPSSQLTCNFGIGSTRSEGVIHLTFPIGRRTAMATFHVVPADIPFILCINDMDRLGINLINTENVIRHEATGESSPITRFFDHPFLLWDPSLQCFFSEAELCR